MRDFLRTVLLCCTFAAAYLSALPAQAGIAVEGPPASPAYWMRADGDVSLLSAEEIGALNHRIAAGGTVRDLAAAAAVQRAGTDVRAYIRAAAQEIGEDAPSDLYESAQLLPAETWRAVRANCAEAAVPHRVTARCAVAVQRADVRLLPTRDGWYEAPDDDRCDMLQGTVLDPGEAVLVLHRSKDGGFAFVETRDYRGWVATEQLVFVERAVWRSFLAPEHFVTVAMSELRLLGDQRLFYQLGAKIPLVESSEDNVRRVLVPLGDVGGLLAVGHTGVRIQGAPADEVLPEGRLPLTHNNIVRLAFALDGTPYGWGGAHEGMDCSSYVQNIYRAMGIELPRDADMQEKACTLVPLTGLTREERYRRIADAPAGALLFRPGHVMLYLGQDAGGVPLVIHDISSYYENGDKHYIQKVLVSNLDFQNARGTAAIDTLSAIGLIAPAP